MLTSHAKNEVTRSSNSGNTLYLRIKQSDRQSEYWAKTQETYFSQTCSVHRK